MTLDVREREAERELSEDLQYLAEGVVVARPAGSAKAMRRPVALDAGRRWPRFHLVRDNEAGTLRMFAPTDDADSQTLSRRAAPDRFINLRDR